MFDDFDNDEIDEISQIQKNSEMKQNMDEIKDMLVRQNYKALTTKGIDIETMNASGIDIQPIAEMIEVMIEWFIDSEEYEKCQALQNILDKINA
jgi:hypothetical protein